jgi:hypothetical protein
MKKLLAVCVAALAAVGHVACSDGPMDMADDDPGVVRQFVLTEGIPAPPPVGPPGVVALSAFGGSSASLGGSNAEPVTLTPNTCDEGSSRQITITFSVTGIQSGAYSFKVHTTWTYNGTTWSGSNPTTVTVPNQGNTTTSHPVQVSIVNNSTADTGTDSFGISTFDIQHVSGGTVQPLTGTGTATIHVAFSSCGPTPAAPTLVVPDDIVAEATSSAGATVNYLVTATDYLNNDITDDIVCNHASGIVFPIGGTKIECAVTAHGFTTSDDFWIYVQDTTAPEFTDIPTGTQPLTATDINGLALDLSQFTIAAKDKGPNGEDVNVSAPVTIACTIDGEEADGYQIAIGQEVTVSCTATDAASFRAPDDLTPAPNTSAAETFSVSVGLDLSSTCGFGSPLRNEEQYSAHKRNSTIPHKVCAPKYADGELAKDLAGGLKLVLVWVGAGTASGTETFTDPAAGSTVWRWDETDQHYIFNAKTANNWALGEWRTTVEYADIELAETNFFLNK